MKSVAECKKANILPESGTPVVTRPSLASCDGFLVNPKHIIARREGPGIIRGWVASCGGDVWWIEHEDGSVGAYMFTEVFDPEPPSRPRFRTYRRKP
jgi:hypothetical protein